MIGKPTFPRGLARALLLDERRQQDETAVELVRDLALDIVELGERPRLGAVRGLARRVSGLAALSSARALTDLALWIVGP